MAEETPSGEGGDIRRKALIRLAIAGLITALALTGLWWLDRSGNQAEPPAKSTPSAITTAPPTLPPPPAPEPPADAEIGQAATGEQSAAEMVPPPPPQVTASPALPARQPEVAPRPNGQAARAIAPAAPSPPTVAAPTRAAPAGEAGRGGYTLQLGVFSNPANAQEMVERLRKKGVHAYLETRVLVGPFTNRGEAQQAQTELKRMGIGVLLSQPAASQ